MLYLPFGLAPRLRNLPWFSLFIGIGFFVASFTLGSHITKYQERLEKLTPVQSESIRSRWALASTLEQKRSQQKEILLTADPKLNRWVYQAGKSNFESLWITPWIIPQFFLMLAVAMAFVLFGGFIESRLGSFLFAFNFLSIYYLGYFVESFSFMSRTGVSLGGSAALYILAGAYLALFPLRDFSLWTSDELRPRFSIPVWLLTSLGLIAIESLGLGGYSHVDTGMQFGYFHFVSLILSYLVFGIVARARPLAAPYLSHAEVKLCKKLSTAVGSQAPGIVKKLIQLNPSHLEPLNIYYKRVIAPIGNQAVSPENQKFLDRFAAVLVAHYYDKEDYRAITKMMKVKPLKVLPSIYFRLLHPSEWLILARHMDHSGEWMEAVRLYATMLDYFSQPKVRGEAIKRAEVVIHRSFKEAIERPGARRPILQQCKSFLEDYPNSKVASILIDHVEHFKKRVNSEREDSVA